MSDQADDRPLFTDLYELTMGAVYFARGLDTSATFELFVRGMPPGRNVLLAAGLEQVLGYLEELAFQPHHLQYLRALDTFDPAFLEYLESLRFTGDLWAMPEGTAFFPDEPVLRITAPRVQAQVIETYLLTAVNLQSMVASKAARIALACQGRPFVDFSARRDHGVDAAVNAARAAFIAGAAGTSNLLAGQRFGIPTSGTMAHSLVMSYDGETEAFVDYLRTFPDGATLLIDTYDVDQGARNAVEAHRRVADSGAYVGAVRLDSGDVAAQAHRVRAILDDAGLDGVRIFVSGDLDEHAIAQLLASGAPVDAFGVGTRMGVSADAPYLSGVYKLVEDSGGPRFKRSSGKETLPGAKQVWRRTENGIIAGDVLSLADETIPDAEPLLVHQMDAGRRTRPAESLTAIRERCLAQLEALPAPLRSLDRSDPYPVDLSPGLRNLRENVRARLASGRAPRPN